jgi:hypothetical protein
LKNRGLLASLQKRQKHDLTIWEFQGVMMCGRLFVDLSEDRGLVFDLGPPRQQTFPSNVGCKGQLGSWQEADG